MKGVEMKNHPGAIFSGGMLFLVLDVESPPEVLPRQGVGSEQIVKTPGSLDQFSGLDTAPGGHARSLEVKRAITFSK
jgi:hypothetical protein